MAADSSAVTSQIASRVRAAEEDHERRTQVLAARASGILERLGGVKPPAAPDRPDIEIGDGPAARSGPAPIAEVVDAIDRLRLLVRMLDEGLITRSEFDAKKADILSRI